MTRCPKCSNLLRDPHARYCPVCGAKQAGHSVGRRRRTRLWVVACFSAVIASALLVWSIHSRAQAREAELLAKVAAEKKNTEGTAAHFYTELRNQGVGQQKEAGPRNKDGRPGPRRP